MKCVRCGLESAATFCEYCGEELKIDLDLDVEQEDEGGSKRDFPLKDLMRISGDGTLTPPALVEDGEKQRTRFKSRKANSNEEGIKLDEKVEFKGVMIEREEMDKMKFMSAISQEVKKKRVLRDFADQLFDF